MKRTEYLVSKTLDPHSDCATTSSLLKAQAMAVGIGHCHFFEYEIEPGVPGVTPDEETLIANHHQLTDGSWERDIVRDYDND